MDRDDLHILVIAAAIDLLVLDAQVGEMGLLVEVLEVVFERPLRNLPRVAIGVSVVVVAEAVEWTYLRAAGRWREYECHRPNHDGS